MKEGLLEKIRHLGHWRVNIRPQTPLAARLSIKQCVEAVEQARVSIRGWDYPHVSHRKDNEGGSEIGGDHFENWCDWYGHVEFWRMFKSGQFLSYNTLREEFSDYPGHNEAQAILSIINTIYSMTEFCEFAHRLYTQGMHAGGTVLFIEMKNTKGRQLWVGPNRMPFFDPKVTNADQIELKRTLEARDWEAGAAPIALDLLLELFDYFGWNPDRSQIKADQDKFLRREFS